MILLKCKMCGGNIEAEPDMTVGKCRYCGSTMTLPKIDNDKKAQLFNKANAYRMNNEFDKAYATYEVIVNEDPTEAEAYWGMILSEYGIEYVEDPATHKRIPTCHRANPNLIVDSVNFAYAIQYADNERQLLYWDEADEIDRLQSSILSVSAQVESYDVFICYKETDDYTGERTLDSVLAQDIYEALTDKGVRTFFARISLEEMLGQNYEPYIYAALTSARIMVVVSTCREYLEAVWVKNEWLRFLQFMSSDKNKILIPAYSDMSPYDLPAELSRYQSQDLSKIGSIQELAYRIKKLLSFEVENNTKREKNPTTKSIVDSAKVKPKKQKHISKKLILICIGTITAVVIVIALLISGRLRNKNIVGEEKELDSSSVSSSKLENDIESGSDIDIDTSDPTYIEGMKKLDAGDYQNAIILFRSMDAPYKDYLIQTAYYEWAQQSHGQAAIERYEMAGDVKNANELLYEEMYKIISNWGSKAITSQIDDYCQRLVAINYKDSKTIYEEIKKWKVLACHVNTEEFGDDNLEKISKSEAWYSNYLIGGGPLGGGKLKIVADYSKGESDTDEIYCSEGNLWHDGYYHTWYSRYWNDPDNSPSVTVVLRIHDDKGNILDTTTFNWE